MWWIIGAIFVLWIPVCFAMCKVSGNMSRVEEAEKEWRDFLNAHESPEQVKSADADSADRKREFIGD